MKKLIALLLALVMVVGLVACNKTPAGTETKPAPTPTNAPATTPNATPGATPEKEAPLKLQWYQSIGTDSLFEAPAANTQSLYPFMIFDPLMYWDAVNAEMVPALATEWSHNDAYTEFSITIREGVKFHDGEEMDINDVVFTIHNAVANPTSNYHGAYQYVEGYEALRNGEADTLTGLTVEGNTLHFKLVQPQALFLQGQCGACYVLPEHLLGDVAWADIDTNDFWKKPIGTGAYMVNEVSFPDYFTATRFDDYWGEPAGIKDVQFVSYQAGGNEAAMAAMIAGDIDFGTRQMVADKNAADNMIAQNADLQTVVMSGYYTRCFVTNLGPRADGNPNPDLQKKEVRQALDLLIDQDKIASFYGGQASSSMTMVNPNATEYNTDIPHVSYDAEKARALLEAANFDFNRPIVIAYYYDDQTTHDVMSMMVQDFAAAGVMLQPWFLTGDLTKLLTDGNYDFSYAANNASGDNQARMYYFLTKNSSWSLGKVDECTSLFNDLWASYEATGDAAERETLAKQMQALNYEHCYALPAYILNNCIVYNAANVNVPEGVFEVDGGSYYKWNEWSMVG